MTQNAPRRRSTGRPRNLSPSRLRQALLSRRMKQLTLAELIGCSAPQISCYANGVNDPDMERIKAMAAAIGVPLERLLTDGARRELAAANEARQDESTGSSAVAA